MKRAIATAACLVALSSCSHSATQTAVPAAPVPKPAKALTRTWSISFTPGWKTTVERPDPSVVKETRKVLAAEKTFDVPGTDNKAEAEAVVIVGKLPADEADSFLEDVVKAESGRMDVRVLGFKKINLDERQAVKMFELRARPGSPGAYVLVVTTDGVYGYAVACGGAVEDADVFADDCDAVVESLRIDKR